MTMTLMAGELTQSINRDQTLRLAEKVGYLLVPGAPLDHGSSYLLVALRPHPTKAHFDPELIDYWSPSGTQAERIELIWPIKAPAPRHAWGTIRIVDRVGATNRFVSFGGRLTTSHSQGVDTALFGSDAPILGLGGHSDPVDPLAASVDGFFATLRAAAGADPAMARLSNSLSPLALYAAFLWRELRTLSTPAAFDSAPPLLVSLLRSERCRLAAESIPDEMAGRQLAQRLERR
jgi:hypothetical protein